MPCSDGRSCNARITKFENANSKPVTTPDPVIAIATMQGRYSFIKRIVFDRPGSYLAAHIAASGTKYRGYGKDRAASVGHVRSGEDY